jgi:hypothetical protein
MVLDMLKEMEQAISWISLAPSPSREMMNKGLMFRKKLFLIRRLKNVPCIPELEVE